MNTLTFTVEGRMGIITLERPKALNALNPEMYAELKAVLDDIRQNPELRAVVITGGGEKAFCAGADIDAMVTMTPTEAKEFARSGYQACAAITQLPKPVIAAVNGFAFGGGCELMLACDIAIASAKARFGLPETNLAVIPGNGGTQRLPRFVGVMQAKEMIFTGKIIKPEEALQLGLINRVVDPEELMPAAKQIAAMICEKGPVAVQAAKTAINQTLEMTLAAGLEYEAECFASLFATQDQKEGMRAFLEKRPPQYRGV